MYKLFHSSGLLQLVLLALNHNHSSMLVSSTLSNEQEVMPSILGPFQQTLSSHYGQEQERLRKKKKQKQKEDCRLTVFGGEFSSIANKEVKEMEEYSYDQYLGEFADLREAPTFLHEVQIDCHSQGGEIIYVSAPNYCFGDGFDNSFTFVPSYYKSYPVCFVGVGCSDSSSSMDGIGGKVEQYIYSFPQCSDAIITREIHPLEDDYNTPSMIELE